MTTLHDRFTSIAGAMTDLNLELASSLKLKDDLECMNSYLKEDVAKKTLEIKQMSNQLARLHKLEAEMPSSALIMLDGDGVKFCETLLRKGDAGGAEAARSLCELVHTELNALRGGDKSINTIIVRLVCNLDGLLLAIKKDLDTTGTVISSQILKDFYQGLTQIACFGQSGKFKAFFDVLDVGPGKERADHKIKNDLSILAFQPSCRKLVLGICHDNGYARLLNDLGVRAKDEHGLGRKVLLLETYTLAAEIKKFDLPVFSLPKIFLDKVTYSSASPVQSPRPALTKASGVTASFADRAKQPPPPISPISVNGRNSVDAPKVVRRTKAKPETFELIYDAQDLLKTRTNPKLCNFHHIKGDCEFGATCQYMHGERANERVRHAMMSSTRRQACVYGLACPDYYCIYGHGSST